MIIYEHPKESDYYNKWTQIAGFDNPKKQIWMSNDEKPLTIGQDIEINKLPKKLRDVIKKWEKQIEQLKTINFDIGYKLAEVSTSFIYKDKYYYLKSFSFNSTPELHELMRNIIEHDLREIKCLHIDSISMTLEDKSFIAKKIYEATHDKKR